MESKKDVERWARALELVANDYPPDTSEREEYVKAAQKAVTYAAFSYRGSAVGKQLEVLKSQLASRLMPTPL